MSSTTTTDNLKLSQFQNSDVPSWRTDYNADMKKIDDAYVASISGKEEESDIQNGDYFEFYDSSASKNKKTLWSNIVNKLKTLFANNDQILNTVEQCEASTKDTDIAGAAALKEVSSSLTSNIQEKLTSDYLDLTITKIGTSVKMSSTRNKVSLTNGTTYTLGTLSEKFRPVSFVGGLVIISRLGGVGMLNIANTGVITLTPYSDISANEYCYLHEGWISPL